MHSRSTQPHPPLSFPRSLGTDGTPLLGGRLGLGSPPSLSSLGKTASARVEQHKPTYNEKSTGSACHPRRWRVLGVSPARPSRSALEVFI